MVDSLSLLWKGYYEGERGEGMISLISIVMLILSAVIIFGCLEQRKFPNSFLEWVILIVTAFLIVNNVR